MELATFGRLSSSSEFDFDGKSSRRWSSRQRHRKKESSFIEERFPIFIAYKSHLIVVLLSIWYLVSVIAQLL